MQAIKIKHKDYFLAGVLHKAEQQAKATIIISHGFRGSKEGGGRAQILAQDASANFNVLRYDFSLLGSLTNQMQELGSVIAYAKEQLGGEIILFGRSLGGCASLLVAQQRQDIKGLILWSMPVDAKATFSLSLGRTQVEQLQQGLAISLDDVWGKATLPASFWTDLLVHDIKGALRNLQGMPVLFVHGQFDEVVPLSHAEEAFALCTGKKTFALVSGGDHRFLRGFEESKAAVMDWLQMTF